MPNALYKAFLASINAVSSLSVTSRFSKLKCAALLNACTWSRVRSIFIINSPGSQQYLFHIRDYTRADQGVCFQFGSSPGNYKASCNVSALLSFLWCVVVL